jgi:four helix bundle protein
MEETNKIKSFTDLHAWQEGHKLVLLIYEITKDFPKEEVYSLTSQLRRAVVSVTSNIAEGFSRNTSKDKNQFFVMAQGSLTELQNQLIIVKDVGYLNQRKFNEILEKTVIVHKLITGLRKFLIHNT